MFSRIRKRLTFTNVALILVLVFVMTGGAYAAKKYLITSTKQISPAVLKQLEGKAGPAGSPGAQGPAGPAGPAGTNGTNGTNGKDGEKGANGNEGAAGATGSKGLTGTTGPTGPTGPKGTAGINGENGTTGPTGPTGQTGFTETLPSGKTEKGTWVVVGHPGAGESLATSLSFSIPLAQALPEEHVHFIEGEVTGEHEGCPKGSSAAKPEAEPGNLCVFLDSGFKVNFESATILSGETGGIEAGKAGAWLLVHPAAEGLLAANGTWAVTAE